MKKEGDWQKERTVLQLEENPTIVLSNPVCQDSARGEIPKAEQYDGVVTRGAHGQPPLYLIELFSPLMNRFCRSLRKEKNTKHHYHENNSGC